MTTEELHKKFTEYGLCAKEWQRKCILLLPEIERKKVWLKKGFTSIHEYAAKLAGLSHNQVREALRILRKIEDKPELVKIVETKGISAVRPVAAIATRENANFWAEKAGTMPKNELETYVRDFRRAQKPATEPTSIQTTEPATEPTSSQTTCPVTPPASKPATETIILKQTTIARLQKLSNGNPETFLNKMMDLYEKSLKNKPAPKKTESRHIPAEIRKYILLRSHGKCEFPNCDKSNQHLHHSNRFASEKIHDPDQIVALCVAHHNLAHRGLINENTWTIRKHSDKTSLNNYIDQKVMYHRLLHSLP